MSLALRPLLLNFVMRVARLDVGAGRSLLARLRLAVVESRRPRGRIQVGPPSCHIHHVLLVTIVQL
jgi:hypothetical protein